MRAGLRRERFRHPASAAGRRTARLISEAIKHGRTVAAGDTFDLHDDVTQSATIVDTDRMVFADEGETGDPMRYTTAASLADYMQTEIRISASVMNSGTLDERPACHAPIWRITYTGAVLCSARSRFAAVDEGDRDRFLFDHLQHRRCTSGTIAAARLPAVSGTI